MAKHCDVCKQSYSDELTVCPHCAEAPVGPEQSGSQSEANQRRSADAVEHSPDSGIGLGRSVDPVSGQSNVAWASLVEENEPKSDAVKIDSPSDIDLLQYVDQPADSGVPIGESPSSAKTAATSAVDLTGAPLGPTSSTSGSGSMPPASGLRLVNEAIDEDFEGVLMRGAGEGPESARSAAPATDVPLAMPLPSEADFAPDDDEGPRSDTAAVDLGALKPSGTSKSPSGRDLIAEAVESGVDLHKAKAPTATGRLASAVRFRRRWFSMAAGRCG